MRGLPKAQNQSDRTCPRLADRSVSSRISKLHVSSAVHTNWKSVSNGWAQKQRLLGCVQKSQFRSTTGPSRQRTSHLSTIYTRTIFPFCAAPLNWMSLPVFSLASTVRRFLLVGSATYSLLSSCPDPELERLRIAQRE